MSDISPIGPGSLGPLHRPAHLNPVHDSNVPRSATDSAGRNDRVELSEHARWLDELQQRPAVRDALVNQIRQAIVDGTYESEEKLQIAVDRLIDDLA